MCAYLSRLCDAVGAAAKDSVAVLAPDEEVTVASEGAGGFVPAGEPHDGVRRKVLDLRGHWDDLLLYDNT